MNLLKSAFGRSSDRDSAARLLRLAYRTGAVVDFFAIAGMVAPAQLWPARFQKPLDRHSYEMKYAFRSGAPLMAGWTALLVWADQNPIERKGVIAITAVPVVAGLMTNDYMAARAGLVQPSSVIPTRIMQAGLLGLFGIAYYRATGVERAPTTSNSGH